MKDQKSEIKNQRSKIVLLGFMGSGKTTVAKALAQKLDCNFIDLDRLIELREGRSIASIIDAEGEARFREIESKALRIVFEKTHNRIIALGGGAWTIEENRKLIYERDCLTIWLDVPFEICWKRIKKHSDTRPLARDKKSAKRLYDSRRDIYSLSNMRIDVAKEINAEAIANEIINRMKDGMK